MTEFEEVYRLYFQDVYKYALSLTRDEHIAEELTQETFFKALRSIDQFDGRCKVYVWLCQIAKNTYFTQYQRAIKAEVLSPEPIHSDSLEERLETQETAYEIHKILHKMPDPFKEVFSSVHLENYPLSKLESCSARLKAGHGSLITEPK